MGFKGGCKAFEIIHLLARLGRVLFAGGPSYERDQR